MTNPIRIFVFELRGASKIWRVNSVKSRAHKNKTRAHDMSAQNSVCVCVCVCDLHKCIHMHVAYVCVWGGGGRA